MKNRGVTTIVCLCAAILALIVRVDAQNQAPGSSASAPQLRQVAYIKASNAEAADHFGCGGALDGHTGNSVAISADGNTMAIGAHQESSSAKGINGNQNDNDAYASGAVYVFARTPNGVHVARNDDLPGRVDVRRRGNPASGSGDSFGARGGNGVEFEPQDRGHRTLAEGHCLLHVLPSAPHGPQGIREG